MTTIEVVAIDMLGADMTAVYRPTLTIGKTLAGLQSIVGGLVDCFDIRHIGTGAIATVWFHDEGKVLGQPANTMAMALAIAGGWEGYKYGDWIAGNVCLTGFDPETGETMPLPAEWLEWVAVLA